MKGTYQDVPVEKFKKEDESDPRQDYGDIESLKQSLKNNGLQEHLTAVLGDDGLFHLLSGTRRLHAMILNGDKVIPSFIIEGTMGQEEIDHRRFIIKYEQKALTPIEIATYFARLKRQGYSLRDIEIKYGVSPATISNYLKLLNLTKSVHDLVATGRLSFSKGVEISKLVNPKHQERMAKQAIDFGWSAKKTGLKVDRFLRKERQIPLVKIMAPKGEIPGVFIKDSRDMSEIESGAVHLIITSPSYYIGMEFEKGYSEEEHWENIRAVIEEMVRVTCPGGYIIINVGDMHNYKGPKGNNGFSQIKLVGHIYQKFLRKYGIYLKDIIIWCKATHAFSRDVSKAWSENTPHTGYGIHINHDYIYVFQKKGERELPSEDIILRSRITKEEWVQWATSVWMIDRVRRMEGHPAMFPEELVRRLVRMYSYEGDVVLDPFLGSGTTVKVARELGRQAYGYERLEQYKEVIMKKLGIEPAPETYSMVDYGKQSLDLNKPVATDSFLEHSAESKSCKPRFICNEGFADGLLTRI